MKNIIVTGGSGFIGSNFILNHISCFDNNILNLDKLTYAANNNNLSNIQELSNYRHVKGDICDKKLVEAVFRDFSPDIIINFAAETHVDRSIDSPDNFINTNIFGTFNLLRVALEYINSDKSLLFVHVSTDEVFGSLGHNENSFSEQSPYKPSSPYSSSKASSDHLVKSWNITYNLPTIITNCSNNYGPFQFPEKLIPLIIANCLDEKPLPVYGDGSNIRDWLYVNDHCDALNKIIEDGKHGENYNIGGNNEIKNIDLVNKICFLLDSLKPRNNGSYNSLITFVEDRPGHDYRYAINSSKIQKNLNWKPKDSIDSGLKKTIKWYLENESWWRKIQKNNYSQERLGLRKGTDD